MTLLTLGKYLLGSRRAIEEIAQTPQAVVVGLLFVLSAGFAREYDGEDLLHEPWHLLLPLGASLATATLLFLLVAGVGVCRGAGMRPLFERYRVFLSLYWLTAPLAWIYAIPVERFLSPVAATQANLWMLAIVALWRLLLITRVVSVLYGARYIAALFVVMLMADAVAVIAVTATPRPVVGVMGGVHLTEGESAILAASFFVIVFGFLSLPLWFFGAIGVAIPWGKKNKWCWQVAEEPPRRAVGGSAWTLAAALLVLGVCLLPFTQPEQQRRWTVRHYLLQGRLHDALEYMSNLKRDDFPPYWDPPPRIGYAQFKPNLWTILETAQDPQYAPWVRDIFLEKLIMRAKFSPWEERELFINLAEMDDDELQRYVKFVAALPEAKSVAQYHQLQLQRQIHSDEFEYEPLGEYAPPGEMNETRRKAYEKLESLYDDDSDSREPAMSD